jgi:hypothetical protein
MQTSFSQHPHFHELFTRERRRTRMQQFLHDFERTALRGITVVPDFAPVRLSAAPAANKPATLAGHTAR